MSDSSFEYWWETYFCAPAHGLTKDHMREAFIQGFDTCRDKWSGLTYEETLDYEEED